MMPCVKCGELETERFELLINVRAVLCDVCFNDYLAELYCEQNYLDLRVKVAEIDAITDFEGNVKDGQEGNYVKLMKNKLFIETELLSWVLNHLKPEE
jgi:hypothetical protein